MTDTDSLDSCHCCDVPADRALENRPGLSALSYRVGSYGTFFERMKAQIARWTFAEAQPPGARPLAGLTTRDPDDLSIALLDATAVVGDILSFYQERIANEGYLRTALERRSVLELAREIGYELSPGVAASSYLAFLVDQSLVTPSPILLPTKVDLPAGTKVQSVPSQGQLPQTFETVAPLTARVEWNAMAPRTLEPQALRVSSGALHRVDAQGLNDVIVDRIFLKGIATNLRAGDLLLFVDSQDSALVFVSNVVADAKTSRTQVELDQSGAQKPPAFNWLFPGGALADTKKRRLHAGSVRKTIVASGQDWNERDLAAFIGVQQWDQDELLQLVTSQVSAAESPKVRVYAFRARSGVFGNQALPHRQIIASLPTAAQSGWGDWDTGTSVAKTSLGALYSSTFKASIFLDRVVAGIAPGSRAALVTPTQMVAFRVKSTTETSIVDFGMSGKATGLTLAALGNGPNLDTSASAFEIRSTTVWYQSEELFFDQAPIDAPIWDANEEAGVTAITLDRMVLGLQPGQILAINGTTTDASGDSTGLTQSEIVQVVGATHNRGYTTIQFTPGLSSTYVRDTVKIAGNVAPCTHGETVAAEPLGSGDGSAIHQRFTLARTPLTYVSAATASGGKSALTVRVNGVAWQERESLYGLPADSPSYVVRRSDDGKSTISFGDGKNGARLPTGQNNVVASYRAGMGLDGELAATALTILAARPLGLKSVTNPVAASGSAPAETLEGAQQNAPRTVRTLERVVSLDDFTDFARTFAGIGKAQAVAVWNGQKRIVHVTVASTTGGGVPASAPLHGNLKRALRESSDNAHTVRVESFQQRYFKLEASLVIDPRRVADDVVAAVDKALRSAFAFAARELAQGVSEAEVMDVCQAIPGVRAVDINALHDAEETPQLRSFMLANPAYFDGTDVLPAELLLLDPTGLSLTAVTP